ncbi:MAG TPA: glycoside hydrolase family 2 TIM barrel-domain containing protein [Candidatus Sulfotelmatobacter sp.]|nr:glycoside hydrolase family 2 TIM barrel-domain containing protein [Candidatus Sulfotelmatobacter sp.]
MKKVWIAAILLITLAPFTHAQQQNSNLATQNTSVQASDSSMHHEARNAVDDSSESYWECVGSEPAPCWIEISWKEPVSIRELVFRRYQARRGIRDLTHLKAEAFDAGTWHEVVSSGDGKTALPFILDLRLPPTKALKLRISGLDGDARVREVEAYSQNAPAWLDIRGDARGNAIGALTDGFGAAGIRSEVQASGKIAGKPWKAIARTGERGDFTIPLPVGLSGTIDFSTTAQGEAIHKVVDAGDLAGTLVPDPGSDFDLELNGAWSFQPDPPKGFEQPGFDDSSWKSIDVPSHWVMAGFHSQHGYGGYRRHLKIPQSWRGRRVRIAFDGVYSGAEVWWNGRRIGSHTGGATPFQLEAASIDPGADNVIAVLVQEQTTASEMDHMSMYADFSLAGIFRRVHVFSVPDLHVEREQSHAEFDKDFRDADLVTELSVVNDSGSKITGESVRLSLSRSGQNEVAVSDPIALALDPWSRQDQTVKLHVREPLKWNSEHPDLYVLTTVISQNGSEIERLQRKVGFRETQIDKTFLLIDGKPVKLKGTAHHDSHPLLGRAVTPAVERQDLELMKAANIDAVRTSHYPPIPELDDIADELGLYIEEEAPFCWNGLAHDLRWSALNRQVTAEMVERDMSHPSVAYWSAGNESDWGPNMDMGADEIRAHDPSRPVMGSWTDHLDFIIHHNPITVKGIQAQDNDTKPVLWDESLAPYQGIWRDGKAMWRDPGVRDYYVVPLIDVMEAFWNSKVVQASFIWAWSDDLFLVPGRGAEQGRVFTEDHGVERIYYKPGSGLVGDAPWGVIDGWRRQKPEFWNIQNLYSPIAISDRTLDLPASGPLRISVKNRYFFTNLSERQIKWRIGEQEGAAKADIPPQTVGTIEVPLPSGVKAGSKLELSFFENSRLVNAFTIQLGATPAEPQNSTATAKPLHVQKQELLSGITPRIDGDGFSLGVSGERGLLQYAVTNGDIILYDQPQVHILPMQGSAPALPDAITWSLDRPVEISEDGGNVTITAEGHYPDLVGSYRTVIKPDGEVTVSYDFEYGGPEIAAQEVGLRFELPLRLDRLSWERRGELS